MDLAEHNNKYSTGRWVLWSFVAFFGTIASLDAYFVYMAISTNTGVIIQHPYEKGLAYNQSLEKSKMQPPWIQKTTYKDGVLRWILTDENKKPIVDAVVKAHIIRPVQTGYDFDIVLKHKGHGVYEARPHAPLHGQWQARISGIWNNQQYQTTYTFIRK